MVALKFVAWYPSCFLYHITFHIVTFIEQKFEFTTWPRSKFNEAIVLCNVGMIELDSPVKKISMEEI